MLSGTPASFRNLTIESARAIESSQLEGKRGVLMGLPRDVALKLAAQMVKGAAEMVLETGQHPGALKDHVASPAGTTIAGIQAMEDGAVRAACIQAVQAAAVRSQELAQVK